MKKTRLLLLLVLLMTAATGAWGMQIYISYPSWPTGTNVNGDGNLVLEMEASDSFENMKAKIEDKSGLNPTYMKLYFNSVEMANNETLNAKGVTSNSVLTLVYTLYNVTMKDGVKDADKWTISPNPAPEGSPVTIQYTGRLKVKGVTATSDAQPAPAGPPSWKLTLSSPAKDLCIIANGGVIAQQTLDVASTEFTVEMPELTSQTVNIFATDGSGNCWYCTQENMSFAIGQTYQSSPTMTALDEDNSKPLYKITGTSGVTIPDGKTVVLSGVNISNGSITCNGSVTMILLGSNSVTGANQNAAIKIGDSGTTLTITGSGSLTAQGGTWGAGIGTNYYNKTGGTLSVGNIVINGGTVTATGGTYGAGIGTGQAYSSVGSTSITCGDITINGGTVTATGGYNGAGIGTGMSRKISNGSASNRCGNITIGTGVISVTATKGSNSPNSIGKGYAQGGTQTCGTITIGGTIYWDGSAYQNGGDTYLATSPLIYEPAAAAEEQGGSGDDIPNSDPYTPGGDPFSF